MKRITFLAAVIVSLLSLGTAKAQVSGHIGISFGQPAYYAPERVVVVNRPPVRYYSERRYYSRPVVVRNHYYRRPVVVDRGYYRRPVVVQQRYYGHPGRGHAYGHRKW